MASNKGAILSQKEHALEKLLQEGKMCLLMMQELYDWSRKDSLQYKRVLSMVDRQSRYKKQLSQDMDDMEEMIVEINAIMGLSIPDEEDDDPNEVDLEALQEDPNDCLYNNLLLVYHSIVRRRHVVATMEMVLRQMLSMDGSVAAIQLAVHSKLKSFLKDYRERVGQVLKEKKQSSLRDKYNQLRQLLSLITEKQMVFVDTLV